MKQMLDQDDANSKKDWMLAALVSHHPNLVDNMTTKDNLTFAQLKVRMHSLASNIDRRAGPALVANHGKKSRRPDSKRIQAGLTVSDSYHSDYVLHCIWCKARNFRHEGHVCMAGVQEVKGLQIKNGQSSRCSRGPGDSAAPAAPAVTIGMVWWIGCYLCLA